MGRYDQDFRFGAQNYKQNFFLVKLLLDAGYTGPLHFDAHAYRSEDLAGVKAFARGCMRTYRILEQKVAQFNADADIQAALAAINAPSPAMEPLTGPYTAERAAALKAYPFDRAALGRRGLGYVDQLVFELLMGQR